MTELQLHGYLVWAVVATGCLTLPFLLRRPAPYGRHYPGARWGPHLPSRLGWILMELPAVAAFLALYLDGKAAGQLVPLLFLAMWQVHYLNRTFIYPLRKGESTRRMPVVVIASGFFFNTVNAYVNARVISEFGGYGAQWLSDPRFIVGLAIFLSGMALNHHADTLLMRLRRPGESGYALPRGGLFRFVSCPNYLGEIIEWAGWALATWSWGGFAFWLFTTANLLPRARSNHRWYLETFEDYPPRRKALIPGIF